MGAERVDEFGSLPTSPTLAGSLARAADYAREQAHAEVALEHLLLALTEDTDAQRILSASDIEIARLKSDVSSHIGLIEHRLPPGTNASSVVSEDVKRILKGAAAASRGRRREIDGAIVLAAIVGDGNSSAAHILSGQGLTFDAAIRALQVAQNEQANEQAAASQQGAAPPPSKPATAYDAASDPQTGPPARQQTRAPRQADATPPPAPRPRPANDIIAEARAKVQQRQTTHPSTQSEPRHDEQQAQPFDHEQSEYLQPPADERAPQTHPSAPAAQAATMAAAQAQERAARNATALSELNLQRAETIQPPTPTQASPTDQTQVERRVEGQSEPSQPEMPESEADAQPPQARAAYRLPIVPPQSDGRPLSPRPKPLPAATGQPPARPHQPAPAKTGPPAITSRAPDPGTLRPGSPPNPFPAAPTAADQREQKSPAPPPLPPADGQGQTSGLPPLQTTVAPNVAAQPPTAGTYPRPQHPQAQQHPGTGDTGQPNAAYNPHHQAQLGQGQPHGLGHPHRQPGQPPQGPGGSRPGPATPPQRPGNGSGQRPSQGPRQGPRQGPGQGPGYAPSYGEAQPHLPPQNQPHRLAQGQPQRHPHTYPPPPAAQPRRQPAAPPTIAAEPIGTHELAEFIPPRMRSGRPTVIEITLPIAKLASLSDDHHSYHQVRNSGGQASLTAISIRLLSNYGGFQIEPSSPETQWLNTSATANPDADTLSWRWSVTPVSVGRASLQVVAAGRTLGPDGLASETTLPGQHAEVKVGRAWGKTFARLAALSLAFILGGTLVLFSGPILELAETTLATLNLPQP